MIRVRFVTIPVSDQEKALQFYRDRLGFDLVTDQLFGGGQRWIELRPPASDTLVVLFTPPGGESPMGTFQPIAFTRIGRKAPAFKPGDISPWPGRANLL